ncbi:pyrroline-5-carboxylate reductase [Hyphobacterium sp.]|uniref:pyrroline-5-carboxylate reductase n=1 Tax=Hyphobacterium sp. TaxID=2004662 RepID=UPI003BADAC7D
MGTAMAAGWLRGRKGLPADQLLVVDPSPSDEAAAFLKEKGLKRVDEIGPRMASDISLAVLAVKPQVFPEAAASLSTVLSEDCAIVSVMAGVTIRTMEEALGERPVIRAMPNTPAAIGQGIIVANANAAGEAWTGTAEKLLKVGGSVEWVGDERMLDAVTAVSGSGPAYFFLLAEALAGAGEAEGLPRELAEKLAMETLIGAGALLKASGLTPQELRRQVTSPGGTTQAALDVMMGGSALPELMRRAVNAAERRARQLSDPNRG